MSARRCKCGAPITYCKTQSDKWMPCDPKPVQYVDEINGPDVVLKLELGRGRIIRCRIVDEQVGNNNYGFVPHFATCPHAKQYSKREYQPRIPKIGRETEEPARRPRDRTEPSMDQMSLF